MTPVVLIVNFEHISNLFRVLSVEFCTGKCLPGKELLGNKLDLLVLTIERINNCGYSFWTWTWTLREKCPYSELFWSIFSLIRTEYGEIRSISPYSVRIRENTDQNKSEYRYFLRKGTHQKKPHKIITWKYCAHRMVRF